MANVINILNFQDIVLKINQLLLDLTNLLEDKGYECEFLTHESIGVNKIDLEVIVRKGSEVYNFDLWDIIVDNNTLDHVKIFINLKVQQFGVQVQ